LYHLPPCFSLFSSLFSLTSFLCSDLPQLATSAQALPAFKSTPRDASAVCQEAKNGSQDMLAVFLPPQHQGELRISLPRSEKQLYAQGDTAGTLITLLNALRTRQQPENGRTDAFVSFATVFLFVFLLVFSNFVLILQLAPACPRLWSSSDLQSTPWDASAVCQEAKEQQQRHAGSVLATTAPRRRSDFIAKNQEATLRQGTAAHSLSLLSVASPMARPQALDTALGEKHQEALLGRSTLRRHSLSSPDHGDQPPRPPRLPRLPSAHSTPAPNRVSRYDFVSFRFDQRNRHIAHLYSIVFLRQSFARTRL
jgi:hypothetical protein